MRIVRWIVEHLPPCDGGGWAEQPRNRMSEGCLATAALAREPQNLAAPEGEANIIERAHGPAGRGIFDAQIPDLQNVRCREDGSHLWRVWRVHTVSSCSCWEGAGTPSARLSRDGLRPRSVRRRGLAISSIPKLTS